MKIPLLIIILYMLALYIATFYASKLGKNVTGFLLANRGFPSAIVGVMVAGLAIGGASTIGVAQQAYSYGISAGWYNAAWAAGAAILGMTVAGKYRKASVSTVPELIGKYSDTPGKVLAVICQIVIQIIITSLQFIAGGAILNALLPEVFTYKTAMFISAFTFIAIAVSGGYWAAGLTNIINVIIIYAGILLSAGYYLIDYKETFHLISFLPPDKPWFNLTEGVGLITISAWFIVMITQSFSTQAVAQITFAARNELSARRGFLLGAILILPVGFLCALFGIIAAAKFPNISPAIALPKTILETNPIVSGFALAGLWAADVSTATGLLMGSSTLLIEDIIKKLYRNNVTEKTQLVISKLITLIIGVITYLLATTISEILKTLVTGLTLTTSYTIVILACLLFPRYCKKGCTFWTIAVGSVFLLLWHLFPAIRVTAHPVFLAWPLCLITFFIVGLMDKRS